MYHTLVRNFPSTLSQCNVDLSLLIPYINIVMKCIISQFGLKDWHVNGETVTFHVVLVCAIVVRNNLKRLWFNTSAGTEGIKR